MGAIYVNGLLDSTFTAPSGCDLTSTTGSAFTVGAYNSAGVDQFVGTLDDLRVYNTALSAADVLALYTVDQPVNNFIAHFSFNNNATDSSGYALSNIINGAVTSVPNRFNIANRAYHFSASSSITVGGTQLLQIGPNALTISAWVRITATPTENMRILIHGAGACGDNGFTLAVTNSRSIMMYYLCTPLSVCMSKQLISTATLSVNVWTLVTATIKPSNSFNLYINGVLDGTTDAPPCDLTNTLSSPFKIGSHSTTNVEQFIGDLDDLRIYNTALTAPQVLALYFIEQPTGLIAYLSMNLNSLDTSIHKHIMTNNSATLVANRFGVSNSAYYFGASSSITSPVDTLLQIGPGDFSLSVWIKIDSVVGLMRVINHGVDGCANGYLLSINNGIVWFVYQCAPSTTCFTVSTTSIRTLGVGVWYLITVTVQRSLASKIYINGQLDSTFYAAPTCDISNPLSPLLFIGAKTTTGLDQFLGCMDDARIYNFALSASDVRGLYFIDQPSSQPSRQPSSHPSVQPSRQPSSRPSAQPGSRPTQQPSQQPSSQPSRQPSSKPTTQPSRQPSARPTNQPSQQPSYQPSSQPSRQPSVQPAVRPSNQPTMQPSLRPSRQPTSHPSTQPSTHPSRQPSTQPSSRPSVSHTPTMSPTLLSVSAQLAQGLVLYLPFAGNISDFSSNRLSTSSVGATLTADRFGVTNQAYHFEATSYVSILANSALSTLGTSNFTIAMWVKLSFNSDMMRLYTHGGTSCGSPGYMFRTAGNGIWYEYSCSNYCSGSSAQSMASLTPEVWYHIAYTVQSGVAVTIYINGVADREITDPYKPPNNCNMSSHAVTYIGSQDGTNYNQFNGDIDDVRVYNRALSAVEMSALYTLNYPSGLIAYFTFNGDALDSSGFNHATTINGATASADRFGVANRAYHFTTGQSITVTGSQLLQIGTNDLTLSSWIKLTSLSTTANARIFSHGANGCSVYGYSFTIRPTGQVGVGFACGAKCGLVAGSSVQVLVVGLWYLITVTIQRGGLANIYVNGLFDSSWATPSTCDITNTLGTAFTIGAYDGTSNVEQFRGNIDDVRVYNTALSAADVLSLYQVDQLVSSLVLYFAFNGNLLDSSGNGHIITSTGSVMSVTDRFGISSRAANFLPGSYFTVSPSQLLNIGPNDFTISVWVKQSSQNSADQARIFARGGGTCFTDAGFVLTISQLGNVQFALICSKFCNVIIGPSTATIDVGVWFMITVAVQRSGVANLYINGVLDKSTSFAASYNCDLTNTVGSPTTIGSYHIANTEQFLGDLDELRLYNVALTATEVTSLYYVEQPSSQPSQQPSGQPSFQPSSTPSSQPSVRPSAQPSRQPTARPTSQPSDQPSTRPSRQPTSQPSTQPTAQPSTRPSMQPTAQPSDQPSSQPSRNPSRQPSVRPSSQPTRDPSAQPSLQPWSAPSSQPSDEPSRQPGGVPSAQPSCSPSTQPSGAPTRQPTDQPTSCPSNNPSTQPSSNPSVKPSGQSSNQPSSLPSLQPYSPPSSQPSATPSIQPRSHPSCQPSKQPVGNPSGLPSEMPSMQPSSRPSHQPSTCPSHQPTSSPSAQPSRRPSSQPFDRPTSQPSSVPSKQPSREPVSRPSSSPSRKPNAVPTSHPSMQLSGGPSKQPSAMPSTAPSRQPSSLPSCQPSCQPSSQPSLQPTTHPSTQPTFQPVNQPNGQPSKQPSMVPSQQPHAKPSLCPTSKPSRLVNFGSFPSSKPLSVVSDERSRGFKIVLPFYFADISTSNSFTDVVLNSSDIRNGIDYVIYGQNSTQQVDLSLSNMKSTEGFSVSPAISYDFSGRSASNAGDVNGDGYDDLIIGVPGASLCYVLFGTVHGWVNMTQGFTVFGGDGDNAGWSVSGAGDVNGDKLSDIIIGAPGINYGTGAAYMLFGKREGFRNIILSELQPEEDGFTIRGVSLSDYSGLSVSGAGDVNGDGFDDVVIGALRTTNFYSGAAHVVFGNTTQSAVISLSSLGARGFTLSSANWAWCGYSVSGAGDVNNDTLSDVIIGCTPRKGTQTYAPVSYLLRGSRHFMVDNTILLSASAHYTGGGVVVSGVGDINGDGFDDVMVGSDYDFSGVGYVVRYPRPTQSLSAAPSTASPSTRAPSGTPSFHPTIVTPSTPSSQPSFKPSDPTFTPSERPSQPTSHPSAQPTHPTCRPSVPPTLTPTYVPSMLPTLKPTTAPSTMPSVPPVTTPPSSQNPTVKPTVENTNMPSRFPVVRPSLSPTMTPTVVQFVTVIADTPGVYVRNVTYSVFIVNSTGNVTVLTHATMSSAIGSVKYEVYPHDHSQLRIDLFNTSSDTIDLTSFAGVYSMQDIKIVELRPRRRLTTARSAQIRVMLTNNQVIQIANITGGGSVNDIHFIFAKRTTSSDTNSAFKSYGPLVAGSVIAGSLILYLLYRSGELYCVHKSLQEKFKSIDWDAVSRNNPTYVSFNSQDSWLSEDSSGSEYSFNVTNNSSVENSSLENSSVENSLELENSSVRSDEYPDSGSECKSDSIDEDDDLSSRDSVFMEQLLKGWHQSDVSDEEEKENEYDKNSEIIECGVDNEHETNTTKTSYSSRRE